MYIAYFDGASKGNPGESGIGTYIQKNGITIWEISKAIGITTCNVAEYTALITLLAELKQRQIKRIQIFGDSQLVIKQVNREWNVNYPRLEKLRNEVYNLMQGKHITIQWIPRKKNAYADKLSNLAFKKYSPEKMTHSSSAMPFSIEKISKTIFIVHDNEDYAVDIAHNICTCPCFQNKKKCPHLNTLT